MFKGTGAQNVGLDIIDIKISFIGITHGGSISILNKESYHYALSCEMTQRA